MREDSQDLFPSLRCQQRGTTGRPSAPEDTKAPGVWPQRFGPLTDGLGRNAESGCDLSVRQPALTKKATAFETPFFRLGDLPERLDAVLSAIYLVFNEGYAASQGDSLLRVDLTAEAIRLGRLLLELLPDPEAKGLLALMLLHESRREARVSQDGEIILLEEQDRSRWDYQMISEGTALVEQALRSRNFGAYTLQAAISAVHAKAATAAQTDWNQIVVLYSVLQRIDSSPVVELNRAVAVAMRDGPEAGLVLIDAILERGDLVDYHLAHAARAELCRRSGKMSDAKNSYERALSLARQEPERRFLTRRLSEI